MHDNQNRLGELVAELLGAQQINHLMTQVLEDMSLESRVNLANSIAARVAKDINDYGLRDPFRVGATADQAVKAEVEKQLAPLLAKVQAQVTARLATELDRIVEATYTTAVQQIKGEAARRLLKAAQEAMEKTSRGY